MSSNKRNPEHSCFPRKVEITIINGDVIIGKVNVGVELKRLSDHLKNSDEEFLIVYDAVVVNKSDYERVLFVNKDHILYAQPLD